LTNSEAGIRPEYVGSHDPIIVTAEVTRIFHAQNKEPSRTDLDYWVYARVIPSENGWDAYWAITKMWPERTEPLPMPGGSEPDDQTQLDRIEHKLDLIITAARKYI
jgi:hypothetical protein